MRAFHVTGGALVLLAATAAQAVIVDTALTSASQISTHTNNPFFGPANTVNLAGVNFTYNTTVANNDHVNGVFFDNVVFPTGSLPPVGPHGLNKNGGNRTLTIEPWTSPNNDNSARFQAAGTADPTLNLVANEMFFLGFAGCCNENIGLNFGNLGANRNVYVQIIGGDQGWTGDIGVVANGSNIGTWTTVADGNASTASLYGFDTTTNAAGELNLDLNIVASDFAAIGGIVILGENPLSQAALTNTNQILNSGTLLAATNFVYSPPQTGVVPPGTVNGIPFQDISWENGGPQALTQGGTITVTPTLFDRERNQNTAGTITGPDEAVLESIANSINFLGFGESVSTNLAGLPANQLVRVQVIGGDDGAGFDNWFGDLEVTANGLVVGLWESVADDTNTTASLATFFAMTDAAGNLNLTFRQITPPDSVFGEFAGIAGLVVTAQTQALPEPGTLGLLGIASLALLRRRRMA